MSQVYIVVSMHRSGSSLVANILHENGIVMGEEKNFKPKANSTNEKGFYENYLFRKINDDILKEKGYAVKSWKTPIPEVKNTTSDIYNRMNRLVVSYNRTYEAWAFKDPRTCLTLPVWKQVLPADTRFLFVFRHPIEVAKSLVTRGNVNTVEEGLKIWGTYNLRAFVDLQGTNAVFVNYAELMETGEIADTGLFGHGIIKPSLKHHNEQDVPDKFARLWGAISASSETKRNW